MKHSQIFPQIIKLAASALLAAMFSCNSSVHADEPIKGMVSVGTWATQAEFADVKVTKGNQTLYSSDFSKGLEGWKTSGGTWQTQNGYLRQSGNDTPALAYVGSPTWSDYTLTLKARKTGGAEGFLVSVGSLGDGSKNWWNIGGWGNTKHRLEVSGVGATDVAGTIETGRWYDIRLELRGTEIRAFLDNKLLDSGTQTPPQRNFGKALIPDLVADPSIAEFDGTFYLYATTDGAGAGLSTSGLPVVWKSTDFLNWSFLGSIFPPDFDAKYWAPSAPIRRDGRYYLFPTLDNRITAVVSDSPEGPFRALDGKAINKTTGWKQFAITEGHAIDAEIFNADDGAYYMTWSQRYIAKLNSEFSGFDGPQMPIKTKRGGYSEGPCLFKRDGIYYYLYTLGGSEGYQYAYMMSRTSPLGPWEAPEKDIIATTDHKQGIYGPGHGCFFNPKGSSQWYFVYLEYGRSGTNRQVQTAKLNFNPDGTIQPIQLTLEGVGAVRSTPILGETNLALGKSATASSTRPELRIPPINDSRLNRIENHAPTNALDGSNGSRWLALENDAKAWFQLDLGKAQDIKRTELYFVKPTAGHAYRLEYSLDGKSWQPYGGHDEIIVQSPHTDFKSVRARYLKLTFLQGTSGLWEFRVF